LNRGGEGPSGDSGKEHERGGHHRDEEQKHAKLELLDSAEVPRLVDEDEGAEQNRDHPSQGERSVRWCLDLDPDGDVARDQGAREKVKASLASRRSRSP
jgi:hypothetical protein